MTAATMTCPSCGATTERAAHCTSCGASLTESTAPVKIASPGAPVQRVTVVDVDISFGQLVVLMVKAAIASIPAMLILAILASVVMTLFWGSVAALLSVLR